MKTTLYRFHTNQDPLCYSAYLRRIQQTRFLGHFEFEVEEYDSIMKGILCHIEGITYFLYSLLQEQTIIRYFKKKLFLNSLTVDFFERAVLSSVIKY